MVKPTPSGLTPQLAAQSAGTLFCAGVSFVLTLWLGRSLGTDTFGHYVAVLNLATLVLVLQEGGWPTRIYRQWAQQQPSSPQSPDPMGHALAHTLWVTAALGALLLYPTAFDRLALLAALLCMATVAWNNLVSSKLRGTGRFALEALWQSTGRITSALAIVALLWWHPAPTVAHVFWAWSLGLLVLLVGTAPRWWARPQWSGLWAHYPQLWPFVLMALASLWLLKADVVLLSGLRLPAPELSIYAACTRITEAALLLFAPLGNILLHRFAQLPDPVQRQSLLQGLMWRVMAVGLLIWGVSWTWASELMVLLFGTPYAAAGDLLPWVLAALPLSLGTGLMVPYLIAQGLEKPLAGILVCGGTLLGIAAWGWGATWSIHDMAIAIGLTQAGVWLSALYLSHRGPCHPVARQN